MRLGFLHDRSNKSIGLFPGFNLCLLCNQRWRFDPGRLPVLRHLQFCKYCFLVATFIFGPMMCLHDGGLGDGRDHFLLALVVCVLHLVVRSSHCWLFPRWAILFALLLFLCALLHLGFGERMHSFVCGLLASRCSIMLKREGLLGKRHRSFTSQHRCWSWYPS